MSTRRQQTTVVVPVYLADDGNKAIQISSTYVGSSLIMQPSLVYMESSVISYDTSQALVKRGKSSSLQDESVDSTCMGRYVPLCSGSP